MKELIAIGLLIGMIILFVRSRNLEKQRYNYGICDRCNLPFRKFATDSHGGRGYTCDECGHTVWVSYNIE